MSERRTAEDEAPNAATCSDLEWWEHSGMCGGCGNDDCHDGPCGDVSSRWYDRRICDRCPERVAQGLVNCLIHRGEAGGRYCSTHGERWSLYDSRGRVQSCPQARPIPPASTPDRPSAKEQP